MRRVRGVGGGGRVAAVRRRVRAGGGRRRVRVAVALPMAAVSMPMAAAIAVAMAAATAAVDEVGHVALHAAVVAVHVVPSAHGALVMMMIRCDASDGYGSIGCVRYGTRTCSAPSWPHCSSAGAGCGCARIYSATAEAFLRLRRGGGLSRCAESAHVPPHANNNILPAASYQADKTVVYRIPILLLKCKGPARCFAIFHG